MGNPPRSLACRLDWRVTFDAIGLECPHRSDLPQSLPCPLCDDGAMTVMQDQVLGAEWFYCARCEFAGDLIELVAGCQGSDIEDAISMLNASKLFDESLSDDDVSDYVIHHVGYRHRINEFYRDSRELPLSRIGRSGYALLRDFGMADHGHHELWRERTGLLFGVSKRRSVENLFAPLSFEKRERTNRNGKKSVRRGSGPGKRRIFAGHRWDDVIVVPYFDLPGRIIGFLFIGRDGNPNARDFVYKRANIGCCGKRPKESGVGMMPALGNKRHHIFGNVAFLFTDEKAAIVLQARHLRESREPLPIVLVKSTRDLGLLNLPPDVADRTLIFCGPLTKTLPLARVHNGLVCDYSFGDGELENNAMCRPPTGYLYNFRYDARPWCSALSQHLPKLDRAEAEVLISHLKLTPRESHALARRLSEEAGERFVILEPYRPNQVQISGRTVTEAREGWILQGNKGTEIICNYPIRIESILTTDNGESHFAVTVGIPDRPVDLVIAEDEIKRSSLFDAVYRLLKAKTGEHLQFQRRRWAKESFFIAMQLSNPEIAKKTGRIGWWQDRMRFQFPHFAILNNGDVEHESVPIRSHEEPPAFCLTAPSSNRQAVARLSHVSPETQIVWALAACIANNLLAGNCLREPVGVVLDGEFAHETGEAAAMALGCGRANPSRRRSVPILEYLSKYCGAHDYPTLVRFGPQSRPRIQAYWLDDANLRRSIMSLSPPAAIGVSSHHGFVRIRIDEFPQPLGTLSSAATWIIPSYLEDLCRRKKQIDIWAHDHELLSVIHDMAEWFHERQGGEPHAVLAAQQAIYFDFASPGRAFAELVLRLCLERKIACIRAGEERTVKKKTPVAVTEHEATPDRCACVALNSSVINKALTSTRGPAVNLTDVREDLEAQSAWLGTVDHGQGELWVVKAGWWNETINTIQHREPVGA